ncbi:MAG: tyrosine-type recombinase/integrase [Candidatus Kuenenia stuttgartiensis]|nr:tyrosine-type recombinase/integrase [Candidatus Kuenenia stuttgartiensis]MCZ2442770.1 tyrosine-type recombinase/integrase [Flavobacteriales bacterium]
MPLDAFLQYIRHEKRYSDHTLLSYTKDLEQFQVFLHLQYDHQLLTDVGFQHIRSWIVYLMDEGHSARTVNRKLSTLRSYYKYLYKKKHISANPTIGIKGPKMPVRNPAFVTETAMNKLLDQIQFPDDFFGFRDRMIIEILYLTGMRRAELISLKEDDLDFSLHLVKVLGKRNKERMIPLSPILETALKAYLLAKKEAGFLGPYLFESSKGKKMNPRSVYAIVYRSLSIVTSSDYKSPHTLRHTFATHLLNRGADLNAIKEILGHASLSATQVYTHNSVEKLKRVHHKAHPRSK